MQSLAIGFVDTLCYSFDAACTVLFSEEPLADLQDLVLLGGAPGRALRDAADDGGDSLRHTHCAFESFKAALNVSGFDRTQRAVREVPDGLARSRTPTFGSARTAFPSSPQMP
jgi:hypothetical protein